MLTVKQRTILVTSHESIPYMQELERRAQVGNI